MVELEHVEDYRGHRIEVTVKQERAHAWHWHYGVDGKIFSKSLRPLRTKDEAMQQGLTAARRRAGDLLG